MALTRCLLSASLIAVLTAIKGLQLPQVTISSAYICDHTGALADELEFDFRTNDKKTELASLNVKELQRVSIPVESLSKSERNIEYQSLPLAFSFSFIPKQEDENEEDEQVYLVDPSGVEEVLCCSTFTVVCSKDKIFSLLTTGSGFSLNLQSKLPEKSRNLNSLIPELVKVSQDRAVKLVGQLGLLKK